MASLNRFGEADKKARLSEQEGKSLVISQKKKNKGRRKAVESMGGREIRVGSIIMLLNLYIGNVFTLQKQKNFKNE